MPLGFEEKKSGRSAVDLSAHARMNTPLDKSVPGQTPEPVNSSFTPKWKRQTINLDFWFGPLNWASPQFTLDVSRQYTWAPLGNINELLPLTRGCPADSAGYLLFAHEVVSNLPRRVDLGGMICYSPMVYDRYVADLSLGSEAYWGKFKSKVRYNLKRTIRQFTEACDGVLDWRCYQTPEEVPEFHRLSVAIAEQTYQQKLFDGGLPNTPEFLAHLQEKARMNDLRAYLLFMKGEAIAYLHLEAEDGSLSYAYVGHKPELSNLSPGSVLMASAIDALLIEKRFHTLDFGSGDGQHKQVFSTRTKRVTHTFLLKPTRRNRSIIFVHDYFSRFAESVVTVLKNWNLHHKFKRLVRKAASRV
jgi:hypothetical protein